MTSARPSIILLPGMACDATVFRSQIPALQDQGAVHVSALHTRHSSLPEMAAALLEEHPGDHVLMGSSMGGMLALEVARQAPQRVRAIALLGSTARADTPEHIRLRTEAVVLFEEGRMDEVLRANLLFAFGPNNANSAELFATYLAMVQRAGAAQLIAQNRAVMARASMLPLLPRLHCPLLVVCGSADLLTPPECSREMAALAPHAQLEILPGCGHMLTLERPAQVNELLLTWLAGLR